MLHFAACVGRCVPIVCSYCVFLLCRFVYRTCHVRVFASQPILIDVSVVVCTSKYSVCASTKESVVQVLQTCFFCECECVVCVCVYVLV